MGIFSKGCGPVFLKEDSNVSDYIEKMQKLIEKTTSSKLKKEIEKQIKLASYGEIGENNITFELKNSGMDMFILHDIYLEYEDLSAQIDFLVITPKHNYIIECKNLYGNIEIDNKGNFVRSYEVFGKKEKEGIYSPITQNERHLNVIKKLRSESKGFLTGLIFEKDFDKNYKSIVCLANPKTILNDKYAKKEIKDRVIRADQLIKHIKEIDATDSVALSEKDMRSLAEFFLSAAKPNKSDYFKKYEELLAETVKNEQLVKTEDVVVENTTDGTNEKICPRCGNSLVLRVSKRGKHEGESFFGCSSYPKCRYIEQ